METQRIPPIGQVSFTWDKVHNETQLASLEDDLYTTFRGTKLHAKLAFRRHPKTQIDEILLDIYHRGDDGIERKLCQIPCNPGQLRTVNGIIDTVRDILSRQKVVHG